jgi:DNA-binding LacI/PurR family transcriptional regulator
VLQDGTTESQFVAARETRVQKAGPPAGNSKRRSITSRDLARMLGVSQSAVSRAFTPGASIAPELRERILALATELDYHPNAIASMLSKSRTDIVGIVVSDLQNPFYPLLLQKLTQGLQRIGFQSLIFNITQGSNIEGQLSALRRYNVDAVIIISATVLSGATLHWATEGRAAILINRVVEDANISCVSCDNAGGARAIADHFHALGRRRVAYVAGLGHTTTNMERQHAFITRVAELGMTLTGLIDTGEYSYDAGRRAAIQISEKNDTDAIFFANDILAIGGLDALREEKKRRVPQDISVAGFDDIPIAGWPHYDLTTFRQPLDDIVEVVMAMLEDGSCEPGKLSSIRRLAGQLIVRRSSEPSPAGT